jgi:hypothetical protein
VGHELERALPAGGNALGNDATLTISLSLVAEA